MKRFYDALKAADGDINVAIPTGQDCRIVCSKMDHLDLGGFGEPEFDIYVEGKLLSTISKRWNWDDFVQEFILFAFKRPKEEESAWNVLLNTLDKNRIVSSKNNPNKSGRYLCTCIIKRSDIKQDYRYLMVMEYDADKKYWHDVSHPHAISHIILAWKDEEICNFNDFDYQSGALFEKGLLKNSKGLKTE